MSKVEVLRATVQRLEEQQRQQQQRDLVKQVEENVQGEAWNEFLLLAPKTREAEERTGEWQQRQQQQQQQQASPSTAVADHLPCFYSAGVAHPSLAPPADPASADGSDANAISSPPSAAAATTTSIRFVLFRVVRIMFLEQLAQDLLTDAQILHLLRYLTHLASTSSLFPSSSSSTTTATTTATLDDLSRRRSSSVHLSITKPADLLHSRSDFLYTHLHSPSLLSPNSSFLNTSSSSTTLSLTSPESSPTRHAISSSTSLATSTATASEPSTVRIVVPRLQDLPAWSQRIPNVPLSWPLFQQLCEALPAAIRSRYQSRQLFDLLPHQVSAQSDSTANATLTATNAKARTSASANTAVSTTATTTAQDDTVCGFVFLRYVLMDQALSRIRISLNVYDEQGVGALTEVELGKYVYGQITYLQHLTQLDQEFYGFYVHIAVRKFCFFLDPHRTGRISIHKLVHSPIMQEFEELRGFSFKPVIASSPTITTTATTAADAEVEAEAEAASGSGGGAATGTASASLQAIGLDRAQASPTSSMRRKQSSDSPSATPTTTGDDPTPMDMSAQETALLRRLSTPMFFDADDDHFENPTLSSASSQSILLPAKQAAMDMASDTTPNAERVVTFFESCAFVQRLMDALDGKCTDGEGNATSSSDSAPGGSAKDKSKDTSKDTSKDGTDKSKEKEKEKGEKVKHKEASSSNGKNSRSSTTPSASKSSASPTDATIVAKPDDRLPGEIVIDEASLSYKPYERLVGGWFSASLSLSLYSLYLDLDTDENGMLSAAEFRNYPHHGFTPAFVNSLYQSVRMFTSPSTGELEMDLKAFIDFVLAITYPTTEASMTYLFHILDVNKRGVLDREVVQYWFRDVARALSQLGSENGTHALPFIYDEIMDMAKVANPQRGLTLDDLLRSGCGHTVLLILIDAASFWKYDNKEMLLQQQSQQQ